MARLTTTSPRNSSRSLWPRAASRCSCSQLLWTRACSRSSRSRTGRPRRSARAAAGPTGPVADAGLTALGGSLVDVLDRVPNGADLFGILVGDLRPELLLEAHDELDEIERVRVQVVDERSLGLDLILLDAELLDDDLLEALVRGGQLTPSSEWGLPTATGRSIRLRCARGHHS